MRRMMNVGEWRGQRWQECWWRSSGACGRLTNRKALSANIFLLFDLHSDDFCLALGVFLLPYDDLQQHYLMIYAPKSSNYLTIIFGEGLPNSWLEEDLWRLKMPQLTRMLLLKVSSIKTIFLAMAKLLSHLFWEFGVNFQSSKDCKSCILWVNQYALTTHTSLIKGVEGSPP